MGSNEVGEKLVVKDLEGRVEKFGLYIQEINFLYRNHGMVRSVF